MKKLMAATTAIALLTATASFADESAPNMPIEIVTQDATNTAPDGGVLVPILMMIFMLLVATGGAGTPVASVAPA